MVDDKKEFQYEVIEPIMRDYCSNETYCNSTEELFKLIVKRIEQILHYKYNYLNPEKLKQDMYNTIMIPILHIPAPKEDDKTKAIYLNLLKIEDWFDDIKIFKQKMEEIGLLDTNIVKHVCKELGITQRELAERMEIQK